MVHRYNKFNVVLDVKGGCKVTPYFLLGIAYKHTFIIKKIKFEDRLFITTIDGLICLSGSGYISDGWKIKS